MNGNKKMQMVPARVRGGSNLPHLYGIIRGGTRMIDIVLNQKTKDEAPVCKVCHHSCNCPEDIHFGLKYCPECGLPVCPDCGSFDVVTISRVTGYLSDVAGWNAAKKQELKDRQRYNIEGGISDIL